MFLDDLTIDNYLKEEVKINLLWANVLSIIIFIIFGTFFTLLFYLFWPNRFIFGFNVGFVFISIILIGIIFHEIIHGVFFSIYCKNGYKSVKIGIMPARQLFTPYCNCKEILKINQYRLALIMPTIIMGILPAVIFLVIGNFTLLIFSIIFIGAGAGDLLMLTKLRKMDNNCLVLDHPSAPSFTIYKPLNVNSAV